MQLNSLSIASESQTKGIVWKATISFSELFGKACMQLVADTPLILNARLCNEMLSAAMTGVAEYNNILGLLMWSSEIAQEENLKIKYSDIGGKGLSAVNTIFLEELDSGSEVSYNCPQENLIPGVMELCAFPITVR